MTLRFSNDKITTPRTFSRQMRGVDFNVSTTPFSITFHHKYLSTVELLLPLMPPQANDQAVHEMRRSGSESDFSEAGDRPRSYRDYRVRKSSLIG
jgi:hypothetical protein